MITHLSHSLADHVEMPRTRRTTKNRVPELVQLFKLLADDTRLWILQHLSRSGELHVRALCERLGQSQPAVSHHLALLRVAGLVRLRRQGKHNFYRLEPNRFDEMLRSFFSFFPANDEGQIVFNGQALRYGPMESLAAN